MKLLIQRVKNANVEIENKITAKIDKGLLVFIGISEDDDESKIEWLAKKLTDLRIFEDENGKMNHSVKDIQGEILVVSQFTLYAECKKGNRPDFILAAKPDKAKELYQKFVKHLKNIVNLKIETGVFAADMKVSLINDGPVTILLEK